jgi:hypothetical protein
MKCESVVSCISRMTAFGNQLVFGGSLYYESRKEEIINFRELCQELAKLDAPVVLCSNNSDQVGLVLKKGALLEMKAVITWWW